MMGDHIFGRTIDGQNIWQAFKYEYGWVGTGLNDLLVTHIDIGGVISYYIARYPKTFDITAVIDKKYRFCAVVNAARVSFIESVLKELEVWNDPT